MTKPFFSAVDGSAVYRSNRIVARAPGGSLEARSCDTAATEGLASMPQLSLPCPHCRTAKIGFAARGAVPKQPDSVETLLFLQCEGCGEVVIATTISGRTTVQLWLAGQSSSPGSIVDTYPVAEAPKAPSDVPDSVRSAFLSGLDNLGRAGNTNAAAIMFRRSVELAVKHINPSAPANDSLKKRIDNLPADIATPAMKEWAHTVRLDANEAAHEPDEFSEEDAKQLHMFSEMFLTYAFTLPAALRRAHPPAGSAPPTRRSTM